jgi:YVTN family beta-propeller protein
VNSDTSLTVTAPAGVTGTVDVTVNTPGGTSETSVSDHFDYTDRSTAYVVDETLNTLVPVNTLTGIAGSPISVGFSPVGVAVTPDGSTAYVVNESSGTVTPVDLDTKTTKTPIPVGANPIGIAITPDGSSAYVTNYGSGTVTPIDLATNTPEPPIGVGLDPGTSGQGPIGIAITPDGRTAYVADNDSNVVVPIDLSSNTAGSRIDLGGAQPYGVAISPDGSTVYVTSTGGGDVATISTASNTEGTVLGDGLSATGVAVAPDGATAYISSDGVTPISTATESLGDPISEGDDPDADLDPNGIAVAPDGSTVYVHNVGSGTIKPLDTSTDLFGADIVAGFNPVGDDPPPLGGPFTPGGPNGIAIVADPSPTVSNVTPSSGPAAGGSIVTISGFNLSLASAVMFGATPAASYTVNSSSQITAVAPPGVAGPVDVTVTTAGGTSATSPSDIFTFVKEPTTTVASASPDSTSAERSVVLKATVSPSVGGGVPTGSVTFSVNGAKLCVASLASGSASCSTSGAPVGSDSILAEYGGDLHFLSSSAITPLTITPAHGYWLVGADGGIFTFGAARFHGSTGNLILQRPVVGITPTSDRGGYWLVASDGGIFAFGDSGYYGSIPGVGLAPAGSGASRSLDAPIVGMVPSTDGHGYFMVAADGGVFAFGDARFEGSCPGIGGCSGTAVAVMPDATGNGYWLVTSTGSVYSFGDAKFHGQPGQLLGVTVTSAVRTPDGGGYWILLDDGGVEAFGDAQSYPPALTTPLGGADPATAIFATADGAGYWVASALGAVYPHGDAPSDGSMAGQRLNAPIVAATGW